MKQQVCVPCAGNVAPWLEPRPATALALATLGMVMLSMPAWAGTAATEFDGVWDTLVDWSTGQLGKILAATMVIVGLAAGVMRQSVMAFVVGVAGGMGIFNMPTILDGIVTGTVPLAAGIAPGLAPVVDLLAVSVGA